MLAIEDAIILDQTLPRGIAKDMSIPFKVLKGQFDQLPFLRLNHE
jgi:hypothetical protein